MIKNVGGNETETKIIRTALYARVSTDDQRDRQTIDAQVTALRELAPHWGLEIVGEYLDDGVSGTLPLEDRPAGFRLAEDARAGSIDLVVFYKLDRLARSLRNFLNIVDFFEDIGVGLRSMTETFDTTNPMGRFAVQMMAAVAELERGTIIERTSMGRARVAALGKWSGGVVPFGYHVNSEGFLTAEWTPREGHALSEAEIVQRIFKELVEDRSSANLIARQLNAEGIPWWHKYHKRGADVPKYVEKNGAVWWPSNITRIIKSPTYKGLHIYGNKIEREVPALVDLDTWESAQTQLKKNRNLSKRDGDHEYLLRGLMRCAECGLVFNGYFSSNSTTKWRSYYYRCGSQHGDRKIAGHSCNAKVINSEWIEHLVWADIKGFVKNPGDVIHKLRDQMKEELTDAPKSETRRQELQQTILAKEQEKDRVLDAYRRGLIEIDDLDEQIKRSLQELEPLKAELATIAANEAQRGQKVGDLVGTESLLESLREAVDGPLNWETKREVVEALVDDISVETAGTGRKKTATLTVTYNFSEPVDVVENRTS